MWDIRAMVTLLGIVWLWLKHCTQGLMNRGDGKTAKQLSQTRWKGWIYIYIKYWSLRGFVSKLDIYNLQTLLFLQHPERILMLEIQSTYKMLR